MAGKEFDKLKSELLQEKKWPLKYMFKFIAPNEDGKVKEVVSILPANGKVSYKHTKNLKFVSITCVAMMKTADSIVDKLEEVGKISGVMSL